MKKWLALLISAASTLAIAGVEFKNVPEPMHKPLSNHGLKSAQLDNGVLRVQINKPVVNELVYSNFIVHGICAEQWRNPARFATLGLTRVEALDASGTQGFAFDARGGICEQMGVMGQNVRTLINQRSVVCNAGVCPPQP
ncbi:hypothetical protein [Simplicispira psychrophila]|uniref:hypothetical protein n=1 Tax=Simplicispira psychrophila TaxID=80882 RepID=UPI000480F788|nr:hypothetical protein [Simplicispira psychrophila]